MKKKYIIYTFGYGTDSGGSVVLYKLKTLLSSLGQEAYVYNCNADNQKIEPFNSLLQDNNTIAIYPEVVLGNPLNAKNCVRWVLNNPGRYIVGHNNPSEDLYYNNCNNKDLFFNYSDIFNVRKDKVNYGGLLTVIDIDRNLFKITNTGTRDKTCYFVKKGGMPKCEHPANSVNISTTSAPDKANIFNQSSHFYCYDNECFNVVLAALCGCIAIVIPSGKYTADEWYKKFPWKTCGIAYGADKLEYAQKTLTDINDLINNYEATFLDSVKNFIEKCESL